MKRLAMVAMVVGCISSWAAQAASDSVKVKILVHDYAGLTEQQLTRSLDEGTSVLRHAGIEPEWCVDPAVRSQCLADAGQSLRPIVILNLLNGTMASRVPMDPNHFGFAEAGTAYIHVQRVQDLARAGGVAEGMVLGHIITHEIGHLLLGPNAHARSGIMSAFLSKKEIAKAHRGQLQFSSGEAQRMRERLSH